MKRNHDTLARSFHVMPLAAIACVLTGTAAFAEEPLPASSHLNEPGPENLALADRVGLWNVTETTWSGANAEPVVTTNLVAERRMVGAMLEEVLRPPADAAGKEIKRLDLLSFNRVEGRWGYVSFDTRAPVGLMHAWSSERGDGKTITLTFAPFATPGGGTEVMGQLLRMEQVITFDGPDREVKDQYFTPADGTGTKVLGHRYAYRRANAPATVPALVPARGASGRVDEIRRRGSLRVAVLDEYPWLKRNAAGDRRPFRGAAWRLAEEYARRLGVALETVPVNFENKVSILAGGQADITVAPLLVTPAREKIADFIPYSMSAQSLFGLADNPKLANVRRIEDLDRGDITIAYVDGTPQGAWLQQRLPRAARRGVAGNLADVPVDEIRAGRADVTTIDKFFFAGLAKRTPGLVAVPKDSNLTSQELPIPIGMAIDKHQPVFLEWLRAVAEEIRPELDVEEAQVMNAGD